MELLIDFQPVEQTIVARIYDVPQGSDGVPYTLRGSRVEISSNTLPSVTMVTKDGWWQRGDAISYNLDITVDDFIVAIHEADKVQEYISQDRKRDFFIRIRDTNGDGRADYDWRTVFFQKAPPFDFVRTYMSVNTGNNEAPVVPTFPWPYIGNYSYGYEISSPHETRPPPIQIDWLSGQIGYIGEFVSSRGNDKQWFVYSFEEVKPGQITNTNFESPFPWYDLAEDNDRRPELAIRVKHYWPNDPVLMQGRFPEPLNNIRYSWDQNNDGFWDYKLGLLGKYSFDSTVTVDDVQMRMLPYESVPNWVISQPWGVGIFVAADSVQAMGEGIYEWDAPAWLAEGYFAGRANSAQPPATGEPITTANTNFRQILPGYRGEYQIDFNRQAYLYLSPIDQKLHLLGAAQGMWNVDGYAHMYYHDLNQDGYVDTWRFVVRDYNHSQLHLARDLLLYSSQNKVSLKRTSLPPATFEVLPPTTHAEWLALQQRLPQDKALLQRTDLLTMLQQFNGPTWTITGARVDDVRYTADGVRFVLHLAPEFEVQSSGFVSLDGLAAGSYVVQYVGNQFTIAPLTAPVPAVAVAPASLTALQNGTLDVALRNGGTQDMANLTLEVSAELADLFEMPVAWEPVQLLAQEETRQQLDWSPPYAGDWTLTARLLGPDGEVVASSTSLISVQQPQPVGIERLLAQSVSPVRMPLLLLGVGGFVLVAMVAFGMPLARLFQGKDDDEAS